eukprot:15366587-Ditylum_brightwellii.AAC.1
MKTSNTFSLPSASFYHSTPPLKWTTRYGMYRERLTMDDKEWQSFKLSPSPLSHWSKVIKAWQSLQLPSLF